MRVSRMKTRRGFTMLEVLVVLIMVGVVASVTAGKFHLIMVKQRVQRAATVMQNDLEGAFAISTRNHLPIRISWDSTKLQMNVTDRSGALYYRKTAMSGSEYGLTSGTVSFSRSPLEVYPNGLANDTLTITISASSATKSVHMTRAGLITIQ